MMKKPDFLHVDTDSWKLCPQDCMSRKNEWNKLIFGVLIQIQES